MHAVFFFVFIPFFGFLLMLFAQNHFIQRKGFNGFFAPLYFLTAVNHLFSYEMLNLIIIILLFHKK
jgi:hypothetical protein